MNDARRQQHRRLYHAGWAGLGSVIAALLGFAVASAGATALGGLPLLAAVGLVLYARHWLSLAGGGRVGARSEDEVQRALAALQAEGWRIRHSLPWQGPGDVDSVAIAPTGIAVAIETTTRTYDGRHLARVWEAACVSVADAVTGITGEPMIAFVVKRSCVVGGQDPGSDRADSPAQVAACGGRPFCRRRVRWLCQWHDWQDALSGASVGLDAATAPDCDRLTPVLGEFADEMGLTSSVPGRPWRSVPAAGGWSGPGCSFTRTVL